MNESPIDFEAPAPRPNGAASEPEWDDPIGFDAFDVPEFPVDVLPDWLATWCRECAVALQVPIDLPAMLGLAVVSLCIAKKIAIEVKPGWAESTNLYAAIALSPGEGKSPVFVRATAALRQWESEQRVRLAPQIAALLEERKLVEERVKHARTRAIKDKNSAARQNAEQEARELAVELAELRVPALPRLTADDATPEAVGRLLPDQGGRLGIFSSEGGPLAILAGRYSEGRANLELFCKAYSGDPYTLDRVGRPSICLESPLLTIALTVQPIIIEGLAATPEMRGQGLLARFLYAMPRSLVGTRDPDAPSASAAVLAAYDTAVRSLLELECTANDEGEICAAVLPLSETARAALIAFKAGLEPRLGPAGDLHALADWGNKLAGTVARIACVLHVADHAHDGQFQTPVETGTMVQAIAVGEYAIPHARAAFSVMGSDPATELAKRAWQWIRKRPGPTVSRHELHRGLHLERAADLDAPLALLVDRFYLRPVETEPTGGRPKSATFEINPQAKGGQK